MSHFLLLLLALVRGTLPLASAVEQSPYLKEILEGRCYFAPPTKDGACPAVVGSIMNVLESHLDADIKASDFEAYLEQGDFSSPPNKAIFYLRFFGAPSSFSPPPGFVTPESTLGGALLKDLVFCGVDQHENCSIEKSKAYWTFWEAAYARFASQVKGHVQVIVEPMADIQFLQRSAIAKLQADAVTSVSIYGSNGSPSSHEVDLLTGALQKKGIENISCKNTLRDFYLDSLKHTSVSEGENETDAPENNSTQQERSQDKDFSETSASGKSGACSGTLFFLLTLVLVFYAFYYFLADDRRFSVSKNGPLSPVRDCCKSLLDAMHDLWWRAYTAGHDYFVVNNRNNDEEDPSENSPLTHGSDFIIDEFGCRIPIRQAVAQ